MFIQETFYCLSGNVVRDMPHIDTTQSIRALFEAKMREHGRCIRSSHSQFYNYVWTFQRHDIGVTVVCVRK